MLGSMNFEPVTSVDILSIFGVSDDSVNNVSENLVEFAWVVHAAAKLLRGSRGRTAEHHPHNGR